MPITPDQSDDGFCDDASAHCSQTNWLLIAFAALGGGSFGPFDLRFRQDVIPERCVFFEAVGLFIKRSQQRILREVARDSLSHAQVAVLDWVNAQSQGDTLTAWQTHGQATKQIPLCKIRRVSARIHRDRLQLRYGKWGNKRL